MSVQVINPETGERTILEISDAQVASLDVLEKDNLADSKLDSIIDRLDMSADAKALVTDVKKATLNVGGKIIKVGKRIVEIVLAIIKKFPNTTFGFILGCVVTLLVGSIPILGPLLASFVGPITIVFGLAVGYFNDIHDQALSRKIAEVPLMFEGLKAAV